MWEAKVATIYLDSMKPEDLRVMLEDLKQRRKRTLAFETIGHWDKVGKERLLTIIDEEIAVVEETLRQVSGNVSGAA